MNKVITIVLALISTSMLAQQVLTPTEFSFHEQFTKSSPHDEWLSEGSISQSFRENGDLESAIIDGSFLNLYYDLSAFDSISFYVKAGQLDSTAYFFYAQGEYTLQEFRSYSYTNGLLNEERVFAVNPQTGERVLDRSISYSYDSNDSLVLKLDTFGFGFNPSVIKSMREYDANDKLVLLADSVLANGIYEPVRWTQMTRTNTLIDTVHNDRYSNGNLYLRSREVYIYNQSDDIDSIIADQFDFQTSQWNPLRITRYHMDDGRLDSLTVFDYSETSNQFELTNMSGFHLDESQRLVRQYVTFYSPFGDSVYNYYHFAYPILIEDTIDTSTTAISDPINESIDIYPNPSTGLITINNSIEVQSLKVFDLQGKQVSVESVLLGPIEIDLGSVPNGVYMMYIETKSGHSVHKLIKR